MFSWSSKYLNLQGSFPSDNKFTVHSGGIARPIIDLISSSGNDFPYALIVLSDSFVSSIEI
jgi:hypothetical protein